MAVGDKLVTLDGLKAVYQELNGNTNDLNNQIDGQTEIPVTNAGFYKCDRNTYYMDENLTSNASYKHAKIACNPGDVFVVSGTSPSNATAVRTYAFADENRFSLERSLIGETLENRIITAPVGTTWLYITNYQNTATVKKGKPITMRVDDIKNTVSSYLFHSIDSGTFDVIWDAGGYNANSGQFSAGDTIRTNEGIDVQQTLLRRVYVTNKNYKLKLYAWNKTTQEYAGMWNGTEIVTYDSSVPVEYAEINTSTLGNYLVRFVLLKTDGSAVSTSDASVVRFEVPWYEQVADESEQPQNYQGREICVFDKMVCIGDSIIHGGGDAPDVSTITPKRTVDDQDYSIPTLLHKMYGIETVNLGRSGATTESWYEFYTDPEHPERESLWSGYDAALIRIGNNDYNYCSASPDGYGDTPAEAAVRSKTNIKLIIDKLKQDNPGIRIFLCTLSKANSYDTKAQYRIPLMEAIREIPNEHVDPSDENSPLYGESVFIVDTNQYSNYQSSGGYYYGHPTAIGYQAIAQDIGSIISYIIKTQNEKFKWVRWIGTDHAVTDGVTPGPDDEDDVG